MVLTIAEPSGVGKAADADIPVEELTGVLMHCDVWIEFNRQWLLYSTPFERAIAATPSCAICVWWTLTAACWSG